MQPQGTAVTNPDYYANMVATINNARSCAELQTITNNIMNTMKANTTAIVAQQAKLAPILALLTPPASPNAAVTWISNFITGVLTPQYQPAINYVTQLADIVIVVGQLDAAITAKQAQFPSCSISIPVVP
jgi:hypothetical protein